MRWLRYLWLTLALSWMGTLFFLSNQPRLHAPTLFSGQDKLIHALAYGLLGVLLLAAQTARAGRYSWQQIAASIGIASLYGASDELHQAMVPGRSPEVGDWLADTLGAAIAVLLTAWLVKNRHRLKPASENKVL
jgi:VanZ family protein